MVSLVQDAYQAAVDAMTPAQKIEWMLQLNQCGPTGTPSAAWSPNSARSPPKNSSGKWHYGTTDKNPNAAN